MRHTVREHYGAGERMAKWYSVSFPEAEAQLLEIEAKKQCIKVTELLRRRARLGATREADRKDDMRRDELNYILRELTMISVWVRGEIDTKAKPQEYAKQVGIEVRKMLAKLLQPEKESE